MKVSEYFDAKKRESKELVDELTAHLATWPTVKAEYDRIDAECIPLAAQLSAEQLAESPRAFETEGALKLKRWKRDGLKRNHHLERDRLHRELEKLNRPPIDDFGQYALSRLRSLTELYRYETLDHFRGLDDRRISFQIRVKHNGAALRQCRDRILALKEQIWDSMHAPLAEIEKRIADAKREIENFETETMEIETVGEDRASEIMRVEEKSISAGTVFIAPGVPNVFMKNPALATPRLKALETKINFLEKNA